jgi:deoxyribodipyrimidine photolyase-related protein
MMEVRGEATYVRHHQQKIALFLSAMRHFAAELRADGWQVDYIALDDPANCGSLTEEIARAVRRHTASRVRMVEPGEWRLRQALDALATALPCPLDLLEDDRFIASIAEFRAWASGRKALRMEYFYRDMRRKTGLLMDGAEPVGGQWNFDADNRSGPDALLRQPPVPRFAPDAVTGEVLDLVARTFPGHFGRLDHFNWPVTRAQAEEARADFLAHRLPMFGTYQDAMVHGQDQLFHSLLSAAINLGLLDPLETCRLAETEYREGRAPLNAVEGFIRQIVGWREFVRGMYWWQMPGLATANALDATRPLPDFYWTGDTRMRCLADAVRATRDNAHAHHIQRLMVLGNFALLAGIAPDQVADWFLAVYADAIEWVELPNVAGMALWADGGVLASKPYAASGAYIHRMSDYCGNCAYSVSAKTGPQACPFNALYWHFMHRNRPLLERNQRIGRIYANWDKMAEDRRLALLASAEAFLASLAPAHLGWARENPVSSEIGALVPEPIG